MANADSSTRSPRIVSLDVLRGLNVLVMLFVNDLAGVRGAPGWMKHFSPHDGDGMTFVDVVFPAFLFIVGMSLPIALERRLARGGSLASALGHVATRTASLLFIGVLMVNEESYPAHALVDSRLWALLVYLGVCLVWMSPAAGPSRAGRMRQWIGWLVIAAAVLLYRASGASGLIQIRPHWWGILGLIGWAYLVTSVVILLFRRSALALAAAVVLLYCVFLADGVGFFGNLLGLKRWIAVGSMLGSHAAITASGALLGLTLAAQASHAVRIRTTVLLGGVLAAAALMLHALNGVHPMFIYNKIAATPPWCLLSSAYTAWIFALCYWIVDVRGAKAGTQTLASAGQNALCAYLVGPIAYAVLELLPLIGGFDPWGWLGASFAWGFPRSLAFAVAAIVLTAYLQRRGLPLRV
jgi:heparan-alpha-glucosaminide N-acetyltransferase